MNTIATLLDITIGTKVFFSECYDEEYGAYCTASATVCAIEPVIDSNGDGMGVNFWLTSTGKQDGEYRGEGYANAFGAVKYGNGNVYLTADAVPAVNCSSEEINWEEQG